MKPQKQFEYKNGIATRINNNPEGHNKHTKKELLVRSQLPEPTEFEKFTKLDSELQRQLLHKLGNELWEKKKDILPLARRFTSFKNYYEAKHFGWEWEG